MYAFSYLEINTCCILILIIIFRLHLKNLDKRMSVRAFRWLLIVMLCYTVFDLGCGLAENGAIHLSQNIIIFLNLGFFFSAYLLSYLSFFYAEAELEQIWIYDKKREF